MGISTPQTALRDHGVIINISASIVVCLVGGIGETVTSRLPTAKDSVAPIVTRRDIPNFPTKNGRRLEQSSLKGESQVVPRGGSLGYRYSKLCSERTGGVSSWASKGNLLRSRRLAPTKPVAQGQNDKIWSVILTIFRSKGERLVSWTCAALLSGSDSSCAGSTRSFGREQKTLEWHGPRKKNRRNKRWGFRWRLEGGKVVQRPGVCLVADSTVMLVGNESKQKLAHRGRATEGGSSKSDCAGAGSVKAQCRYHSRPLILY